MGFILEFLREFGLFIVYALCAVTGVIVGKKVRDRKDAKKAVTEQENAEAAQS